MEYTQFVRKCGHTTDVENSTIEDYNGLKKILSTTICTMCTVDKKMKRIEELNEGKTK